MEENASMDPGDAREVLDEVARLRRRTRRDRRAFWLPLTVFGVMMIASAPLYARVAPPPGGSGAVVGHGSGSFGLLGGQVAADGKLAALYWVIAVPLAYAGIAGYYLVRARRRGVDASWRPWVFSGLALFAAFILALSRLLPGSLQGVVGDRLPGDLTVRGLLAAIVVALGFVVLAFVERSWEFGVFAAAFLGLAVAANLYDMANLTARVGLTVDDSGANNLVLGAVLLVAAGYFALPASRFVPRSGHGAAGVAEGSPS